MGFLCVLRKMFPCMGIRKDQVRPHWTRWPFHPISPFTLLSLSSRWLIAFLRLRISCRLRKAHVGFYCGIVAFTVVVLGPSSVSVELTDPQALSTFLLGSSESINSLSKIPLLVAPYSMVPLASTDGLQSNMSIYDH